MMVANSSSENDDDDTAFGMCELCGHILFFSYSSSAACAPSHPTPRLLPSDNKRK